MWPAGWIHAFGALLFGAAALTCASAAQRAPHRERTPWRIVAMMQLAFAVEVVLGFRYGLLGGADALLQAHGWYASRRPVQAGLIALTLALTVLWGLRLLGQRERGGAALTLARVGNALGLALFAVETVSLHQVDAVLYARVGPLNRLACLWALVAVIVALAALVGLRRAGR